MRGAVSFFAGIVLGIAVNFVTLPSERDTLVAIRSEPVDWDALWEAICWVESRGRADAVGRTDDAGIAQITPVYVAEVNRILGEERYTLQDRFSPEKSREMFDIYQGHHNPGKDFVRAVWLHNPRARMSYGKAVEEKYREIKER